MGENMQRSPPWNDVAVFVGVGRLGSFSAAAKLTGMPVSTVSRKVAALEASLKTTLIRRTTRKLHMTEEGALLYESCATHLEGLAEAIAGVSRARTELEGVLRVTAPVALGRGEFIDFVAGFMARHPGVRIDLAITNDQLDLVTAKVDVAIRFGALESSSVIGRRLGSSRRVLVAAPSYLDRRGKPRALRDLSKHDVIVFGPNDGSIEWALTDGRRTLRIPVLPRAAANNLETVSELARRGLGIALLPEAYVRDGGRPGGLARVISRWSSAAIPVHALHAGRKFLPARVRVFLDELKAWPNATWS